MHNTFELNPGHLTLNDIRQIISNNLTICISPAALDKVEAAAAYVQEIIHTEQVVYGINTGFGALAREKISNSDLQLLQHKIILSHAAGTGEYLPPAISRLMLLLKINSLARGYSGIRLTTLEALCQLFNAGISPCIPGQGSVGASGDLAPLAHLCLPLLGLGEVFYQGQIMPAQAALSAIKLPTINLAPKEGLALLNGTQASTAIALYALLQAEQLLLTALVTGAMSVDAARGSSVPFDAHIHAIRGHQSQTIVANIQAELLQNSEIMHSHQHCHRVQDPYSLRCQPQVMGACLANLTNAAATLMIEANAVSDNPLVFTEQQKILSGGNFHAEPVAFAADAMAIAIAEIGALAERRIALLIDPHFSGLAPFLVHHAGLNSGFMLAQVTAAALASENKMLAHPASIDSIPTSANQEDHVSMATHASRRLLNLIEHTSTIVAIEYLAAAQGFDLLRPLSSSPRLEAAHYLLRQSVKYYSEDRYFAPDIQAAKALVMSSAVVNSVKLETVL